MFGKRMQLFPLADFYGFCWTLARWMPVRKFAIVSADNLRWGSLRGSLPIPPSLRLEETVNEPTFTHGTDRRTGRQQTSTLRTDPDK